MSLIVRFSAGDILELKKTHPCGTSRFSVLRTGSTVRIICLGCGRDMTLEREKLERAIKKVTPVSHGEDENEPSGDKKDRKDGEI